MGECPTSAGGGGGIRTHGGLHLTRFRGVLLRPLGHATARQRPDTCRPRSTRTPRRRASEARTQSVDRRRSPRAAPSIPPPARRRPPRVDGCGGDRARRPTATRPHPPWDPTRRTRVGRRERGRLAPAHIVQGSRVTASVHPDSCQEPTAAPARRSASSSAWAVGRRTVSRSLCADRDDAPAHRAPRHRPGRRPDDGAARATSSAACIATSGDVTCEWPRIRPRNPPSRTRRRSRRSAKACPHGAHRPQQFSGARAQILHDGRVTHGVLSWPVLRRARRSPTVVDLVGLLGLLGTVGRPRRSPPIPRQSIAASGYMSAACPSDRKTWVSSSVTSTRTNTTYSSSCSTTSSRISPGSSRTSVSDVVDALAIVEIDLFRAPRSSAGGHGREVTHTDSPGVQTRADSLAWAYSSASPIRSTIASSISSG